MLSIDRYAYTNRLKNIHPIEKISFSLMTLLLCLIFNSIYLYFFVIITMSISILYIARIPTLGYFKMLAIPFPFLIISVLTIIININNNPESFLYGFRVYSLDIGISRIGIIEGTTLFLRSLSCISCMFFLACTTSMVDITNVLKKIKVPMILIEMSTIIYRYIFVLLETVMHMKLSQECRLGYVNKKTSYYSLGYLITNLFLKSHEKHKILYLSLVSRGYTGELNVINRDNKISYKNLSIISIYIILVIMIGIY